MNEDEINRQLYAYQQQRSGPSVCPTQFDYSNCNDDWIAKLLSDPMIPMLLNDVNIQNENLKKENAEVTRLQIENQELTRMARELSDVIEETTLDDFLGPKSSGQGQVKSQPLVQSQPPKGFMSRWFGQGGGLDLNRLNTIQQRQPVGCPVYTKKMNFNQCDVNAIVDFLLKDARISEHLMTHSTNDFNALIENRALRAENETLKSLFPDLNKLNRELVFKVNSAHRIAGTKSPLKLNWKMSYAQGGKVHRQTRRRRRRRRRRVRRTHCKLTSNVK
jgi:hypothetical protein